MGISEGAQALLAGPYYHYLCAFKPSGHICPKFRGGAVYIHPVLISS